MSDPVKNPRPTQTKCRKPQTDEGNSEDISFLSATNATADKSHMTPTMCAQSATPTNMWLQMLQGHKKEGRHLTMRNRSTMTSRPGGLTRGALVFLNTNKPIPTYTLPDYAYGGGAQGEPRCGGGLKSVMKLPRDGWCTRRGDQEPITHAKTRSEDQTATMGPGSENIDQV
jgi:hypothetical protein